MLPVMFYSGGPIREMFALGPPISYNSPVSRCPVFFKHSYSGSTSHYIMSDISMQTNNTDVACA